MNSSQLVKTIIEGEAKDILREHGVPDVNVIDISHERIDKKSDYNDFGINIILPANTGRPNTAVVTNAKWQDWMMRNISAVRLDSAEYRFTIPGSDKQYLYAGDVIHHEVKNIHLKEYKEGTGKILFLENITRFGEAFEAKNAPVAMLYDNTIVFWWNLNTRTDTNVAIIRFALTELLKSLDQTTYPPRQTEEARRLRMKNKYIEFTSVEVSNLKQDIERSQDDIHYLTNELTNKYKTIQDAILRLGAYEEDNKKRDRDFERFFERVSNHPKLEAFDIVDNQMTLEIKDLHIKYGSENVALPRYVTTVDLRNGQISATTKDPLNFVPIHPHIFERGEACMGNFIQQFAKIVASGNLSQVVDFVIEFLQSYNPASPVPGGDWLSWSMAYKFNVNRSEAQSQHPKEWEKQRKDLAKIDARYRRPDDDFTEAPVEPFSCRNCSGEITMYPCEHCDYDPDNDDN